MGHETIGRTPGRPCSKGCGWVNLNDDSGDRALAQIDHDQRDCPLRSSLVVIDLVPGDANNLSYGIVLKSRTTHSITGPNVHNRSFQHLLQVWLNSNETDPRGNWTGDDLSFLFSAQASVIALHPLPGTPERGESIAIGDVVLLRLGGRREIGKFRVVSGNLSDPHLERIAS